jgi:hypothetical protein
MDNYSKLADAYLAIEVSCSSNDSWANREREVYSGEAMEKELDELFPIHRLIDPGIIQDVAE